MLLDCSIEPNWILCKNCFDMAAFCFDYIITSIGVMPESVFIAQYLDKGTQPGSENPNLHHLRNLTNGVKTLLYQEPVPKRQVQLVWENLKETVNEMTEFGDENKNLAAAFMSVLMGIDLYVQERNASGIRFPSDGPLNQTERADTLVYIKSRGSLIDTMKNGYNFRKDVNSGGVRDVLSALLMVKKSDFGATCGYPQIRPLYIHDGRDGLKSRLKRSKTIKIALIPDQFPRKFEFDEKSTPGSTFRISYASAQDEDIDLHCRLMEEAIKEGANLIIFPEFFISMDILDGMKRWLKEQRKESWMRESSLIAVFAGTTWHDSDNNVMHLLDWEGEEMGTYYKYSPFTQLPSKAGESDTYNMCELLTTPGKKCTLLDVEIVGRILPSICRDVIDGLYTEYLVKEFTPFLLLTSAYSGSVASFKRHYSSYASRYYVTSVLCNACDAVNGSKLNLCTVPMKDSSEMQAYTREVMRCGGKPSECSGSCYIFLEVNYKVHRDTVRMKGPIVQSSKSRKCV